MQEKKIHTIDSYLKDKDKLLTAFGIFMGMTIFTKDVTGNIIGGYLSFFFITLTFLIWIEIWGTFPDKDRSWTLIIFENIINMSTILLFCYWIVEYYHKGKLFIFLWLAGAVASILTKLNDHYGYLDFFKNSKIWKYRLFRYLIGALFIVFYLGVSFAISGLVLGGLEPIIEEVKSDLKNYK